MSIFVLPALMRELRERGYNGSYIIVTDRPARGIGARCRRAAIRDTARQA
jgi:hypothetical protein